MKRFLKVFFALWAAAGAWGCLQGTPSQTIAPAGMSAEERATTETIIASAADAPSGGVVSAPVDVEGWDPESKGNAADLPNATPNRDKDKNTDQDQALIAFAKNTPVAPGPPQPPTKPASKPKVTACDQAYFVRLYWPYKDFRTFLELDGKGSRDYFLAELENALRLRAEQVVAHAVERDDLCIPENEFGHESFSPLVRTGSAIVFRQPVFDNSNPVLPTSSDDLIRFLDASEVVDYWTPPPLKLPGK